MYSVYDKSERIESFHKLKKSFCLVVGNNLPDTSSIPPQRTMNESDRRHQPNPLLLFTLLGKTKDQPIQAKKNVRIIEFKLLLL